MTNLSDPNCQSCPKCYTALRNGACPECGVSTVDTGRMPKHETRLIPVLTSYCWRGDLSPLKTVSCQSGMSCRILDPQTIELTIENPRLHFGAAFIEPMLSGYVESYSDRSVVLKLGNRDNPLFQLLPAGSAETGEVLVRVAAVAADSTSGPIIC